MEPSPWLSASTTVSLDESEIGTGGGFQVDDAIQQIPDVVGHDRMAAENRILNDSNFSVRCTSELLRHFVEDQNRSALNALQVYAGQGNEDKVTMWRRCEQVLQARKVRTRDNIRAALNACKPADARFVDFWEFILHGLPGTVEKRAVDIPDIAHT